MKIHTARGEDNLADLATRLFKISGRQSMARKREAVEALQRANPHLKPNATIPPGTPVVVPDVEGLDRPPESTATVDLTEITAKQLQTALSRAGETLGDALAEKLKEEEESARQLREHEPAIKDLDRTMTKRLQEIKQAQSARIGELSEHKKELKSSLAQLNKDLATLLKIALPG